MKKRFLCILVATALLLGILAGCGNGSTGASDSDKPGVGSTEPEKLDKGGQTNDDPVAVMEARVKAVNDAINYTCLGLEEKVEAGLLFYDLYSLASVPPHLNPDYGKPHDYNPDKPLDYRVGYEMRKVRTEGIANEDTYAALLKDLCQNKILPGTFSAEDVIETDDLYIYCSSQTYGPEAYCPWCCILVKDTHIVYWFTVEESWYKADYYEYGYYPKGYPAPQGYVDLSYTEDDAEYIFTDEFWKAFAQTVKFVGDADDDTNTKQYERIVRSTDSRGVVKVPYIEAWYAGGTMNREAILDGFEDFVKNFFENRDVEVVFYLDDGTEKRYPAIKNGSTVTIDLGNDQVWLYEYYNGDGFLCLVQEPNHVTGERLPEQTKGTLIYKDDITSPLVIDDFGQGEPTMFFNNRLYRYAGNGEVTLIHDFSKDVDESWRAMTIDADRTHLMFSGWPHYERLTVIDLKTFAVMDDISITYVADADGIFDFYDAEVNGVSVDEATAWAAADKWYSDGNIELTDRMYGEEADFNSAWRAYDSRG